MKKAISLVELMIAVSLMGVVILGAAVFDASSRKFMSSSERKTAAINELHLALDYMQKDASSSTTSFSSVSGGKGLCMYYDVNNPSSPGGLGSNNVTYLFGNVSTTSVERCNATGACIILSKRFIAPAFTLLNSYSATVTNPTVRYAPAAAFDNSTNPQVSVPTVTLYASEAARN